MDSNDINTVPTPRDWFATAIEYEGHGRAEFNDPKGVIEGHVKIRFDEFGESSVDMEVESIDTEELHPGFGLIGFLNRMRRGSAMGFLGGLGNPCIRLTVDTEHGVFSAAENIFYGFSADISSRNRGQLSFQLQSSQFDAAEASAPPKYWGIPLCNFLSEFMQQHQDLDRHPLRIFPTPTVPSGLSESDAMIAENIANQKNRLIVFEFNKGLGFIEPLVDFDERKSRLIDGRERKAITSVMVGDVGANSINLADLERWFPSDFLLLLALASGVEVGAPWIEFRDDRGLLVRRIHATFWRSLFSRGHEMISETFHRGERSGTGHLLTIAPSSPYYGTAHFRVVLQHIVRGGLRGYTIQDKLAHLFRALDALCEQYALKKTLRPNDTLGDDRRTALGKVFKDATKKLNEMAKGAANEGDEAEAKTLLRIAGQLPKAMNIETGFGKAVMALLERFELPDGRIIDAHYEEEPRPDKRRWSDVLSRYRGLAMHVGYFDEGRHDLDDIVKIYFHLHDILVRIIFKMLRYEGNYQPTVAHMTAIKPTDWVDPDTPPSLLGY